MLNRITTAYGILEIRTLGKSELSHLKERPSLTGYSEEIGKILSLDSKKIYGLEQVHGTDIIHVDTSDCQTGDGLFSNSSDSTLFVKTADCMPIFFWSEEIPIFGILHSGWKGTKDGITENCIQHMKKNYPDRKFIFSLGPCIRREEYEVREDVSQFFLSCKDAVVRKGEKLFLGLDRVIAECVNKFGYEFSDSGISNYSNPGYYSHRRGDTGRNLNIIRILP